MKKMLRRSLVVAALFASMAGLQSATVGAVTTAAAAPPVHSVTGCCWVHFGSAWMCVPC